MHLNNQFPSKNKDPDTAFHAKLLFNKHQSMCPFKLNFPSRLLSYFEGTERKPSPLAKLDGISKTGNNHTDFVF